MSARRIELPFEIGKRSPLRLRAALSLALLGLLAVCGGPGEAALVEREIGTARLEPREVQSDVGWNVRIDELRAVVTDLELTSGGELQTSLLTPWSEAIIGAAHAHPGHTEGGEVLGELLGRFVVDFTADAGSGGGSLGRASLIAGAYDGMNFTFARASAEDGVAGNDPLFGHSLFLSGEATREGVTVPFTVAIDQDEGRRVNGAIFAHEVSVHDERALSLALLLLEPSEGKTIFDGIDFATVPADGAIPAGHDVNTRLKRALQSHDFWELRAQGESS